jgi:hypothetical protein
MRPHVLTFENPPSFNDLVAKVRIVMNDGCDVRLHGRYDMRGNRPIYVMLPLVFKDEWQLYKYYSSQFGLKGAEVVAEITPLSVGEINVHDTGVTTEETIADPIEVEQPSQEEWHNVTHRVSLGSALTKTNPEALNLTVVTDEFNANTFAENVDTEQYIEEDDETTRSESDEENMQPSIDTASIAAIGLGGEGNETNVPSSVVTLCDVPTSSCNDWGFILHRRRVEDIKVEAYKPSGLSEPQLCMSHWVGRMWQLSSRWWSESKGSGGSHKEGSTIWVTRRCPPLFPGLRCTSPSTIRCGEIKQRHVVHHKVSDFEL